ncbi:MAG: hypothetical protein FWF99_06210 [Desulfovibrionaceae bacterium]|nr:hypothetical protein [Desulfovibrionaceae bacterium]
MRRLMTAVFVVAVIFVAGNAYAATTEKNSIDGFWGMTWGTSFDEIKNNMAQNGYVLKDGPKEMGDTIHYIFYGKFFGEETDVYLTFNTDNKFVDAQASLKGTDEKYRKVYELLVKEYTDKIDTSNNYNIDTIIPSVFREKAPPRIWVDNIGVLRLSRTIFNDKDTISLRYSENEYFKQVLKNVKKRAQDKAEEEQRDKDSKIGSREIVNIYNRLSGIGKSERGEFEKKEDYESRIKNIENENIKQFTIKLNGITPYSREFKYNIDKEEFVFEAFSTDFMLVYEVTNLGSYSGENAFGVKKDIKKEERNIYSIKFNNIDKKSKCFKNDKFTFSFKCDPDTAKKIKQNLILIAEAIPSKSKVRASALSYLAGNAQETYSYTEETVVNQSPTISDPSDIKSTMYAVYAAARKFTVVNKETGDIIYAFDIDSQPSAKNTKKKK